MFYIYQSPVFNGAVKAARDAEKRKKKIRSKVRKKKNRRRIRWKVGDAEQEEK